MDIHDSIMAEITNYTTRFGRDPTRIDLGYRYAEELTRYCVTNDTLLYAEGGREYAGCKLFFDNIHATTLKVS